MVENNNINKNSHIRTKKFTCIVCPRGCKLKVMPKDDGNWAVSGNLCPKGAEFAKNEMTNPMRCLTSTVKTTSKELPFLPVRTDGEIPKASVFSAMEEIKSLIIDSNINCGDVIVESLAGTDCNLIATSDLRI